MRKVSGSSFVLTCTGKSPEGLSECQEYAIDAFDDVYLEGLANIVTDDIDPALLGLDESNPLFPLAKQEIVETIQYYIDEYTRQVSDNVAVNALAFYRAFLTGKFKNYPKNVIVVYDKLYKVWRYEETGQGEEDILQRLAKEPSGVFAMASNGYWKSNILTLHGLKDEDYTQTRSIGLMMSASFDTDVHSLTTTEQISPLYCGRRSTHRHGR